MDACDVDRLRGFNWYGVQDGGTRYAYAHTRDCGMRTTVKMHRLIAGARPGEHVDHANCDGLDNRRENLRVCSHSQNLCNRGPQSNTSSGYKGVGFHKASGKWRARVGLGGSQEYLGVFDSPEEAARAYDRRATELHGEFVRLNNV